MELKCEARSSTADYWKLDFSFDNGDQMLTDSTGNWTIYSGRDSDAGDDDPSFTAEQGFTFASGDKLELI